MAFLLRPTVISFISFSRLLFTSPVYRYVYYKEETYVDVGDESKPSFPTLERTYKQRYQGNGTARGPFARPRHVLSHTYGRNVKHCPITILFFDPRFGDPNSASNDPAWFALESAATFVPDACILLLTASLCVEQRQEMPTDLAREAMRDKIYTDALPLFRGMIDDGKVRLSFLDKEKYEPWDPCFQDKNMTNLFYNYHFWNDEFLDLEGDMVLTMQADSVFCRELDLSSHLLNAPYVGAVWPPFHMHCQMMTDSWASWLAPPPSEKTLQQMDDGFVALESGQLLNRTLPPLCEKGHGMIGNGGFTLRSRRWAMKVIETCPNVIYSGLDLDETHSRLACKVSEFDQLYEDFYFAIVLTAIGAPMPSILDAATFSVEHVFREHVIDLYGVQDVDDNDAPKVEYGNRSLTVPVGLHKPYFFMPDDFLLSPAMQEECPFVQYIFSPGKHERRKHSFFDNTILFRKDYASLRQKVLGY